MSTQIPKCKLNEPFRDDTKIINNNFTVKIVNENSILVNLNDLNYVK